MVCQAFLRKGLQKPRQICDLQICDLYMAQVVSRPYIVASRAPFFC